MNEPEYLHLINSDEVQQPVIADYQLAETALSKLLNDTPSLRKQSQ